MKSCIIFASIALSLLFVSMVSAIECNNWGPWVCFCETHPNQEIAHQMAWDAAEEFGEGYICQYNDQGCELVWQGSVMLWKCCVCVRRCRLSQP